MATITFETAHFQPEKNNYRIVSRLEIRVSETLAQQFKQELNGDTHNIVCPISTRHDSGYIDTIIITDKHGMDIGGVRNI